MDPAIVAQVMRQWYASLLPVLDPRGQIHSDAWVDIPPQATAYRAGDARATKAAAPEPKPATSQPSVLDLTDEQLIELLDGLSAK